MWVWEGTMKQIINILDKKAEEWLLVAGFLIMVIFVIMQVIFRYVINVSLGWSEEVVRYGLIWMTWISTSYAIQKNSHIRVEIVKNLFSSKIKKIIETIVIVLWFSLVLFLAIEGTKLVMTIHSTGQVSPSTQIPMWFVYLAVPIGATLMSIRLLQELYKLFKYGEKEESELL